jgi:hypothetical protein
MSDHQTTIVPHDPDRCPTARHAEGGDCGTRFEVRCSCGWAQGVSAAVVADAIAVGHRAYDPRAPVIVTADIPGGREITDPQLRDLFANHCACRPLDLTRGAADHAANHDCDVEILRDVQLALGAVVLDDLDRAQARHAARERCADTLRQDWLRHPAPGLAPAVRRTEEPMTASTTTKSDVPHDRLTRICDTMIDAFNAHGEKQPHDRAIVFLVDQTKGGIGVAGYDDDADAIVDLVVHLRAIFRARGQDLHFVPVGTTPPGKRV